MMFIAPCPAPVGDLVNYGDSVNHNLWTTNNLHPSIFLMFVPCTYLTPPPRAGNLVNYGGSVDHNLWTTNVPAPSAQFITGTKPDGSPSYMLYDPTGESTRGLPQPRYGELKNFGYVPKPGQVRYAEGVPFAELALPCFLLPVAGRTHRSEAPELDLQVAAACM